MFKLSDCVPDIYFPTAGHSEGFTQLNAFDQALLDAGIGDVNLVKMSSIVPPACQRVNRFSLPEGSLVPVAYTTISSDNEGEWIAAAVACAVPDDSTMAGLIMEYHGQGRAIEIEAQVREMAIEGMRHRGRAIRRVTIVSSEHQVECNGAVIAGIVLWWNDRR